MKVDSIDNSLDLGRVILWQYESAAKLQKLGYWKDPNDDDKQKGILQSFYDSSVKDFWDKFCQDIMAIDTASEFGLSIWSNLLSIARPQKLDEETGQIKKLSLNAWRRYIKGKFFILNSIGSIANINNWLKIVFGLRKPIFLRSGKDMTMSYAIQFTPDDDDQILLELSDFFPHPTGVLLSSAQYRTDLIFGFGGFFAKEEISDTSGNTRDAYYGLTWEFNNYAFYKEVSDKNIIHTGTLYDASGNAVMSDDGKTYYYIYISPHITVSEESDAYTNFYVNYLYSDGIKRKVRIYHKNEDGIEYWQISLDGYLESWDFAGTNYYDSKFDFPAEGENGAYYFDKSSGKIYRYDTSIITADKYVEVNKLGIKANYNSKSDFPSDAQAEDKAYYFAIDTKKIYRYDASSTETDKYIEVSFITVEDSYSSKSQFPTTPEDGAYYLALDTNTIYKYNVGDVVANIDVSPDDRNWLYSVDGIVFFNAVYVPAEGSEDRYWYYTEKRTISPSGGQYYFYDSKDTSTRVSLTMIKPPFLYYNNASNQKVLHDIEDSDTETYIFEKTGPESVDYTSNRVYRKFKELEGELDLYYSPYVNRYYKVNRKINTQGATKTEEFWYIDNVGTRHDITNLSVQHWYYRDVFGKYRQATYHAGTEGSEWETRYWEYTNEYGETAVYKTYSYTGEWYYTDLTTGEEVIVRGQNVGLFDNSHYIPEIELFFKLNGGNLVYPPSKIVHYLQQYGELPTPLRDGYLFKGWYRNAEASGEKIDAKSVVIDTNDTQYLYAKWGTTLTVTFDFAGGEGSPYYKEVNYGQPYGELPSPTRSGYVFNGWIYFNGTEHISINETSIVNVKTNHTLVATWEQPQPVTVSVTFEPNNGDVAREVIETVGNAYEYDYLPPEREHYCFDGWYEDDETFLNRVIIGETLVENPNEHTLYAKWKKEPFDITVSGGNHGCAEFPTLTVSEGCLYGEGSWDSGEVHHGIPAAYPCAGYRFAGWMEKQTRNFVDDSSTVPPYSTNWEIEAQWDSISYLTISLHGCGKFCSDYVTGCFCAEENTTYGDQLPETLDDYYSEFGDWYKFTGWYANLQFTGDVVTQQSIVTSDKTNLYARWALTACITLINQYGSPNPGVEVVRTEYDSIGYADHFNFCSCLTSEQPIGLLWSNDACWYSPEFLNEQPPGFDFITDDQVIGCGYMDSPRYAAWKWNETVIYDANGVKASDVVVDGLYYSGCYAKLYETFDYFCFIDNWGDYRIEAKQCAGHGWNMQFAGWTYEKGCTTVLLNDNAMVYPSHLAGLGTPGVNHLYALYEKEIPACAVTFDNGIGGFQIWVWPCLTYHTPIIDGFYFQNQPDEIDSINYKPPLRQGILISVNACGVSGVLELIGTDINNAHWNICTTFPIAKNWFRGEAPNCVFCDDACLVYGW